jgi:uncharacterized phage-associated protein
MRGPMYEARKICNLLISRADSHSFELTNLRLNKLLFFIHGWALTSRPEGVVRNHFIAWKHGPVVRPVFDSFKIYGDARITEPARYLDYDTGEDRVIPYDDILPADADLILRTFAFYDRYTTGQLVDKSHEPGGPWDTIFTEWSRDKRLNPRIPNQLIREYFLMQSGGVLRH